MKNFNKNLIYLFLSICSLLIGIAVFYYFVFALPKINMEKEVMNNEIENQKLEAKNKKELFSKKKDCEQIISDIKKEMEEKKYNSEYKPLFAPTYFEFGFYSPKENSCFYVAHNQEFEYFIFNALTRNKITSFQKEQYEEYKTFILDYSDGEVRL